MKSDHLTHSYLALREKLFRHAVSILKDEDTAKDAMQDAYLNLWSKNPVTSDSEAGNKLFKALRNRCIDILRHQNHKTEALGINDEPIESPSDIIIEDYEKFLVSNLSDRQREVYRYIIRDGLEYDEVADITGRSVESIRTEMSRIRKKIHRTLNNHNSYEG